jgi:hypothetical protein
MMMKVVNQMEKQKENKNILHSFVYQGKDISRVFSSL